MQHRGEIVERAVRQSGYSLTKLTIRLGKSRRWIYHAFENPMLPIETIFEIGKIIHYDFSDELVELKKFGNAISLEKEAEEKLPGNSAEFWKNKYLNLLEKYNALLENTSSKISKISIKTYFSFTKRAISPIKLSTSFRLVPS